MHHKHKPVDPAQTAFTFEEIDLPAPGVRVAEAQSALETGPDHVPVYGVFLRRSDVLSTKERPVIRRPADVAAVVWEYLKEADREHFVVLFLDTKNRVTGIHTVSIGIIDSTLVHPREVFKAAILSGAAGIILAHNHPSGDPTPSAEDRRITQRLVEGGQLLGIEVMDHVVVGDKDRWVSFKEKGLL